MFYMDSHETSSFPGLRVFSRSVSSRRKLPADQTGSQANQNSAGDYSFISIGYRIFIYIK